MATRKNQHRRTRGARTTRRRSQSNRRSSRTRRQPDAIAVLREDHARVIEMFGRFGAMRGNERKEKLTEQICDELEVHTQIEEEIFYPAVREAIGETDLIDEALVEHQSAKELISQIRAMRADEALYDARVTVLGEYVKHHVKEEQGEIFPKARRAGLDLVELGERMRTRKGEIASGMLGKLKRILS